MISRSSHQRCSVRKGALRNFTKFTGKHLCQSFFFNKVAGVRPATLLKKRLSRRCFPVNFVKFLRTPFSQNTSWPLLLDIYLIDRYSYLEDTCQFLTLNNFFIFRSKKKEEREGF